jgi:hypothetical protein
MSYHSVQATITTTSGGAATVYLGSKIRGLLVYLKYSPGTIATGGDLVITGETSGTPILTKANAGTSDVWYYPRAPANQVADGAAITDSAEMIPILSERIKVVVAQGGNVTTGTIEAVYATVDPY